MTINNVRTGETITSHAEMSQNKISFTLSFNKFLDTLEARLEKESQKTQLTHIGYRS